MKIAILAAGTWGTALAKILVKNHTVMVWSAIREEIETLAATNQHKNLPGVTLPPEIQYTTDLSAAAAEAELVILATPSLYVRNTTKQLQPLLQPGQILACVAKGLEPGTLLTMSGIIEDVLQGSNPVVALSGPTHAEEVALDMPTLIVAASKDRAAAEVVRNAFSGTCIRPYTNGDILGVELCGALKNIIALACGIATGLGYGDNTKAAIMTRGIAEIHRLGHAMGCADETFAGLAGIGDLIVTATSNHSRNNRAGQLIGQGKTVQEAIDEVNMVVEGINALPGAMELSEKYGVEVPIIQVVHEIVSGMLPAGEAVSKLLSRQLKAESGGQ